MRTLEEWTKYLERQERSISEVKAERQREAEKEAEVEPASRAAAAVVERPSAPAPPPVEHPSPSAAAPQSEPAPSVQATRPQPAPSQAKPRTPRIKKRFSNTLSALDQSREVAQSSYKPFKETRAQLLERLLDPEISLEDAARILNVCPTTVRRYTNSGVLKHYRTAGNQRRFRLSDILEFLEGQQGGGLA